MGLPKKKRFLIVDTTPDIIHTEQVCIVSRDGNITEYLLGCKKAVSRIDMSLVVVIVKVFESEGDSVQQKLVAQTYDGTSKMGGCYNGIQAIIKEKYWKTYCVRSFFSTWC